MSRTNALIVVKEPGQAPERRVLPELKLEAMQAIVGGSIEYVPLETPVGTFDLWVNEESKLEHLEPNIWVFDKQDVICGTLFVCSSDGEGGSIGLSEDEAAGIIETLKALDMNEPERIYVAKVIADMF